MPTIKQRKVAELIIENTKLDKPLNGGQMLEKVSYSEGIQKQPSRVLESEGVKEALEEFGFTEGNAKKVVSEIMLNEKIDPNARLKATDQVFKVHGSYDEKPISLNQMFVNTKPIEAMSDEEISSFLKSKLNASTEKHQGE